MCGKTLKNRIGDIWKRLELNILRIRSRRTGYVGLDTCNIDQKMDKERRIKIMGTLEEAMEDQTWLDGGS